MTHIHQAYHYNPLNDTVLRQIAFLFGKTADFLDQSAKHREDGNFEEFANMVQRSIAIIQGLSSLFNEELATYDFGIIHPKTLKEPIPVCTWDYYFIMTLQGISVLLQNYTPDQSAQICKNLRDMENFWVDTDYQIAEKHFLESQKSAEIEQLMQSEIRLEPIDDTYNGAILINEITLGRGLNVSL